MASRRQFLESVGKGMLFAGIGSSLMSELGLSHFHTDLQANESEGRLTFGALEPLVSLMQETEPVRLTETLIQKLNGGVPLRTLVAAGALANARTFGGQDYVGFHTFMALAPAYRMSQQLPSDMQPLPVLKVLYRNANRIQEFGGRAAEILHEAHEQPLPDDCHPGEYLRETARSGDIEKSDGVFSSIARTPIGEAFNHLQFEVQDEVDVHRVVLSWRAWDTLEIAGQEWGTCLLRQSIRYCANTERSMADRGHARSPIRALLPKLIDQYRLSGRGMGTKVGDDVWLSQLAQTIFRGTREQAADAVAQAIDGGYNQEEIGEAISLAANLLVLHDPGRPEQWANKDKPIGSCHGDSVGVHASDAANAWRNIARVSNPRNVIASLIVAAFHTAGQSERSSPQPYPFAEQLAELKSERAEELLAETDSAIRAKDQGRAAALVARYGQLGLDSRPVFDLLLRFATSEDGALHAEKYFHTVEQEFATTRKSFRWGQLVALARVSASEFGHRSAGYEEAKRRLMV